MSADQFETTATADGFRFHFDMTLEDFRRWNRYSFGLPMWRRRFTRRVLLVSVLIVCMGLLFMQAYHSAAEFWVLLACIAAWWVLQPQYRKWLAQRNANSTFRAGGLDGLLGETEMEFREDGFSRTHIASGISIYIPYSAILEIAENSGDVYLRHIGYKWTVMPAHTFESAEVKAKWKAMVEARSQMRRN